MPTSIEVDKACIRLTNRIPPPRGWTKEQLQLGYADSLEDLPSPTVVGVIERFLKGGYDPADINPNYAPTPPALAVLCRKAAPKHGTGEPRQAYAVQMPVSPVLEQGIEREDARQLVNSGMYPRGSIWCPGSIEEPKYGTLYGPDPNWRGPQRILSYQEEKDRREAEARETWKARSRRISVPELKPIDPATIRSDIGYSPAARVAAETAGRKQARESEQ